MDKEWVDLWGKNRQNIKLEKRLGFKTWKRDREIWQGKMTESFYMEKRWRNLTWKRDKKILHIQRPEDLTWNRDWKIPCGKETDIWHGKKTGKFD